MNNKILSCPNMTEEEFVATLAPDLSHEEKHDRFINYYYDTDYSDLNALTMIPDTNSRMEALTESFNRAFSEHKKHWPKAGFDFFSALPSGNIELMVVMLCGMGAHSMAKKAMTIRDKEYQFHSNSEKARLIACWSNKKETSSGCLIDVATLGVYGYSESMMHNQWGDDATIRSIYVEVQPFENGEIHYFRCFSKDEAKTRFPNCTYWYTPDPNKTPAEYAA